MKKLRQYTCSMCPKLFQGFCTLFAKVMVAIHPACEWGRKFIDGANAEMLSTGKEEDAEAS